MIYLGKKFYHRDANYVMHWYNNLRNICTLVGIHARFSYPEYNRGNSTCVVNSAAGFRIAVFYFSYIPSFRKRYTKLLN